MPDDYYEFKKTLYLANSRTAKTDSQKNNLQRTRKINKQSHTIKLNKITQFINNTLLKSYKYLKMIILVLYGSFDYLFGKQISAFLQLCV